MISIVNTECHVPKTFSDLAKIAAWGRLGLLAGVSWQDVLTDYMLSHERLQSDPAFMEMLAGQALDDFGRLPTAAQTVLLGVHPQHLESTFATLIESYGSLEGYVTARLGIDNVTIQLIRQNITE